MKKLLLALIIVFAVVIVFQFDADLNPESKNWMAIVESQRSKNSEAFFYLNGIIASENDDVLTVGKRLHKEASKLSESDLKHYEFNPSGVYPESKHLEYPGLEDPMYCGLSQVQCFIDVTTAQNRWNLEVKKWNEILGRYLKFIEYDEYSTLSRPSLVEGFPNYRYLVSGNRVRFFAMLSVASLGDPELAVSTLLSDIAALRSQLEVADTVIHKAIIAALISNSLDALIYFNLKYGLENADEVKLLSAAELSLELPLIREFASLFNVMKDMDGSPEFFEEGGNLPAWFVRIVFKPNMTINTFSSYFTEWIGLSRLPADQFAIQVLENKPKIEQDLSFFNSVGSVLAGIEGTDYGGYITRTHDLNAKIVLVNYILSDGDADLTNPYYPDRSVDSAALESEKFCFDGPYASRNTHRCVFTIHSIQ